MENPDRLPVNYRYHGNFEINKVVMTRVKQIIGIVN